MRNILVTGGAGFIGSNFVRYLMNKYVDYQVVVYDKLTYCGNLDNLRDVAERFADRYAFVHADICDADRVEQVVQEHEIDTIVNFAAETHVDRSIMAADAFIKTDVYGTYVLLEAARKFGLERVVQVSTDEVYGSIEKGAFKETDPLNPSSPYAASKAAGDLIARAYYVTFSIPVVITRGSNTFGPYQYPEKLAPLFITNAIENKPLPLYGDGHQVRDWLYVTDHCEAIDLILHQGKPGKIYNIGGENERTNLEVTKLILRLVSRSESLIQYVTDRPGHDRRYSLDCSKLKALGWQPRHHFEEAMAETVRWYLDNRWWWEKIKTKQHYREYYRRQYGAYP